MPNKQTMTVEEFKKLTKEAGYKPRLHWTNEDGGFGASAYDTKRGVCISYSDHNNSWGAERPFSVQFRHGSQYRTANYCKTFAEALAEAGAHDGDSPPQKVLRSDRFRKIEPRKGGARVDSELFLRRPCQLIRAYVRGVCQLDNDGTVQDDVCSPEIDPFFLVECEDLRYRTLFIVLQGTEFFYVAMKRGHVIKLTATDRLFTGGSYPLNIHDITVEDLKFVMEAVELWTKSL